MPEMDGLQFTRLIKSTQNTWRNSMKKDNINRAVKIRSLCPVVAITACRDKSVEEHAIEAGIIKVLHKPVDCRLLKDTLNTHYFRIKVSDQVQLPIII
jgi:CheY-like chemotaxis protein